MSGLLGHIGLLMSSGPVITPTNRLSVTDTTVGSGSTAHNVNMPATVSAGDLLLCQLVVGGSNSDSVVTTPSGWTLLGTQVAGVVARSGWYYKVAAGTEGGTTVNFVTVGSVLAVAQVHRIQAGTFGTTLLSCFPSAGSSVNPQSTEIPVPWGSTQNTILTSYGTNFSSAVSVYPSGYSGTTYLATAGISSNDVSLATAIKTALVASEAPGAFTIAASRAWAAHTLLIGPFGTPALSGPVVLDTPSSIFTSSATTSHLVNMPATVNAGDRLVCFIANRDVATVATPSGWTAVVASNSGGGTAGAQLSVFFKNAAGTEGGTQVDFVTSAANRANATVYRIQAGTFDPAAAPEFSTATTGNSQSPLPNTITPSWGTNDTLFIPVVGANNLRAYNPQMPGYSDVINANGTAGSLSSAANVATCYAIYRNATSWTAPFAMLTAAHNWVAYTIAIKPV